MNSDSEIKRLIGQAWMEAAIDLSIDVVLAFRLTERDRVIEFIARVNHFGSVSGTLICLAEEYPQLKYIAKKEGFHCSGLYSAYARYERTLFIETLIDWGYRGDTSITPSWYSDRK